MPTSISDAGELGFEIDVGRVLRNMTYYALGKVICWEYI